MIIKRLCRAISFSLIVFLLPLSDLSYATELQRNDPNQLTISNKKMEKEYKKLIREQKKKGKKTNSQTARNYLVTQSNEEDTPEAFSSLIEASSVRDTESLKTVTVQSDDNMLTVILYNQETDTYSLTELSYDSDSIAVFTDDESFLLTSDGTNITAYNEDGEDLVVAEWSEVYSPTGAEYIAAYDGKIYDYEENLEVFTGDINPNNMITPFSTIENDGGGTSGTWGKDAEPFYRTYTVSINILGYISLVGALLVYKIKDKKISGAVNATSIALAAVALVGSTVKGSYYYKFYQARNVKDPTYIREKNFIYYDKDYKYPYGNSTWYFYSARPY